MDPESIIIYQMELAEYQWLKKEYLKAKRAYNQMRTQIRTALGRGAEVEPGPYEIQITVWGRLVVE